MSDDLISTTDAAQRANVSPSTISRAVTAGHLTPVWRGNGKTSAMLFDPADIDAWTKTRQAAS